MGAGGKYVFFRQEGRNKVEIGIWKRWNNTYNDTETTSEKVKKLIISRI